MLSPRFMVAIYVRWRGPGTFHKGAYAQTAYTRARAGASIEAPEPLPGCHIGRDFLRAGRLARRARMRLSAAREARGCTRPLA